LIGFRRESKAGAMCKFVQSTRLLR